MSGAAVNDAEVWRPVLGFEGFYEVSSHGRVRSVDRIIYAVDNHNGYQRRGVVRKAYVDRDGYQTLGLTKAEGTGSYRQKGRVHVLVLEAFVGPCPDGLMACHNDGNPANNHLGNLRWDTAASNMQDRIVHGRNPHSIKTHCKRGHEFTSENTWIHNGARYCRECKRAAHRRWSQTSA